MSITQEKIYPVKIGYVGEGTNVPYAIEYGFSQEEYDKYLRREFPIKDVGSYLIWLDKNDCVHRENNLPAIVTRTCDRYMVHGCYHRNNGPAVDGYDVQRYYLKGREMSEKEWIKANRKRVYFLREKIITLQKLTEIPELFQEVYYAHKKDFMSLLKKI